MKCRWNEAMNLRFLQANAYKNDKTWNNIREHLAWRKEKSPIQWSSNIETFLVILIRLTNSQYESNRPLEYFIFMDVTIGLDLLLYLTYIN